mgnify:CR=1 FL=1
MLLENLALQRKIYSQTQSETSSFLISHLIQLPSILYLGLFLADGYETAGKRFAAFGEIAAKPTVLTGILTKLIFSDNKVEKIFVLSPLWLRNRTKPT